QVRARWTLGCGRARAECVFVIGHPALLFLILIPYPRRHTPDNPSVKEFAAADWTTNSKV
ncbi:hypothetical protein, partial [Pantoea ananatis]|uniref:hypothetical protein n=1 Tax=Pantoea ananas TaxID=553 RepID=UPI0023AFA249